MRALRIGEAYFVMKRLTTCLAASFLVFAFFLGGRLAWYLFAPIELPADPELQFWGDVQSREVVTVGVFLAGSSFASATLFGVAAFWSRDNAKRLTLFSLSISISIALLIFAILVLDVF